MIGNSNANFVSNAVAGGPDSSGPFLAKVVSHLDPTYMGMLEVELLRPVGNAPSEGQLHQVKYISPFYGVTGVAHTSENNDYNGTQKSYGMWMIPPDPGTIVIVFFIDGDPKRGYWFGCVYDENMNFMVPGLAATGFAADGTDRVPVAEYNKKVNQTVSDATKVKKPKHIFADTLDKQGLLKDDIRGITTSSARREVPSMVFGISSPGPIDKSSGATRGTIGKKEWEVKNAFVSRLGGTTLVMDDGDDKFIRKTPAREGKPEYAAVEQGETGGKTTIPHNELFRIRTRTGHQILLHNSEDLIYIGNAAGTAWIEMTGNGKIDIYTADSVSIHTENDFNVTADRDINLTAKRNVNIDAGKSITSHSVENYEIKADKDGKLTIGTILHMGAGTECRISAPVMQINGTPAEKVEKTFKSNRIPMKEPWGEHENIDPANFKPEKTEAVEKPKESEKYVPKYTTTTDTFAKIKGA
jgi:hypothetical protein